MNLDGIKSSRTKPSSEVDLHLCFIKIEKTLVQLCIVIQIGHQLYLALEKIFFNSIIWWQNSVVMTSKCAEYATFGTKKLAKNVLKGN